MSDNVTVLKNIDNKEPNPVCISFAEDLLARAKSGEIQFIAAVAQNYDRTHSRGWTFSTHVYAVSVVGEFECMKMEFYEKEVRGS